jgi:DNA-binding XRE family transcriptional regulator
MKLDALIDQAKKKSGLTYGEMAAALGVRQDRITEWKSGKHQPRAGTIAYFADLAGLPVLETVAVIEGQFDERLAPIWKRALGNFRAVQAAAGLTQINQLMGVVKSLLYRTCKDRPQNWPLGAIFGV